ncbi:hypothetical protein HHI36_011874 [Cryptolaemus montrouzieri]|uniref:Lamin-B receptor n=1 Tax=Cryptolaemus montrouzieri TaxID=559131 RepID=A0ABD2ND54_9CUCU
MMKDTKASSKAVQSSEIRSRKKSPGRTKSPSRKASAPKSPTKPKASEVSKKPVRSKSKTRQSPVRNKSPSRSSPARNKTPVRSKKETSPKRKSPSRTFTDVKSNTKKATVQPTRIDTEFSGSDEELIPKEKPKATVRGRTRKLDLDEVQANVKLIEARESFNTYVGAVRRVTRNVQAQEERVVHLKHFDNVTKKFGEFSDDDEVTILPRKSAERKIKTSVIEYIGIYFQVILIPVFVLSLYIFCNKAHCSLTSVPKKPLFPSFSVFFDLRSFLGYSVLAILLALLSALPFGGRKVTNLPSKQEKFVYVANGIVSLIIILSVCASLEYFQLPVLKFIQQHILHFLISAFIIGVIFSAYLFLRSFYVPLSALNPTEVDKSVLSGFFYGREANPRLLNVLDLKMYLIRVSCVSLVLADISLLVNGLDIDLKTTPALTNLSWRTLIPSQPTLLVLVILHIIYSLDYLIFESKLLSSYFVQYEGLGYKSVVTKLLQPFIFIAQTKYVLEHQIQLEAWKLSVLSFVYFVGYLLYRLSNNQKDSFRRNPYGPTSASLESISTSHGKKLLCSGYWGLLRQPNILGDILIHLALLLFCYNVPPALGIVAIILLLVKRAVSAQAFNKNKYGTSWDKYSSKVKYVLVPKVF